MKKQAIYNVVVSHIQCPLVLLLAALSASESLELGKMFSEPGTVANRLRDLHLPQDARVIQGFSDSDGHNPSISETFQNGGGSSGSDFFPDADPADAENERGFLTQRVTRSRNLVDRMPMSFGKRTIGVGAKAGQLCRTRDGFGKCVYLLSTQHGDPIMSSYRPQRVRNPGLHNNGVEFPRASRGRLERMPLTFGKRVPEDDGVSGDLHNRNLFKLNVRGMLDRMPNYYGKRKRGQNAIVDRLENSGLNGLKLLRLLRSGSKNTYTTLNNPSKSEAQRILEILAKKRDSRMDRMPLTYGKRSMEQSIGDHYSGRPISVLTSPKLGSTHKGLSNMTYGQIDGKQLEVFMSGLDSMPNHHIITPRKVLLEKIMAERLPEEMKKALIFAKRGNAEVVYVDLPFLLRQLEEQKSKMGPDDYSRFKANAEALLSNYLLVDAPLTRRSRSRLGRMPLTYGKRSSSGMLIPPLSRRSRMDRMPLSFGKRSDSKRYLSPSRETSVKDKLDTLTSYTEGSAKVSTELDDLFHRDGLRAGDLPLPVGPQNNDTGAEYELPQPVRDEGGADDVIAESSASSLTPGGLDNLR